MRGWKAIVLLCVGAALVAGCGSDGGTKADDNKNSGGENVVPEEWVGRWAGTEETTDCASIPGLAAAEPDTFSICDGDTLGWPEDYEFECDVNWSATSIDFDCSGQFTFEGCTVTAEFEGEGQRSGNQLTVMTHSEVSYSGDCGPQESFCEDYEATYTRISSTPDQEECGSLGGGDGGSGGGGGEGGQVVAHITGDGFDVDYDADLISTAKAAGQYFITSSHTQGGFYALNLTIPESALGSLPASVCLGGAPGCAGAAYTEVVGSMFGQNLNLGGTITVTEASDTHIAGTFELSGELSGDITGMRTFSSGSFDVSVASFSPRAHFLSHLR